MPYLMTAVEESDFLLSFHSTASIDPLPSLIVNFFLCWLSSIDSIYPKTQINQSFVPSRRKSPFMYSVQVFNCLIHNGTILLVSRDVWMYSKVNFKEYYQIVLILSIYFTLSIILGLYMLGTLALTCSCWTSSESPFSATVSPAESKLYPKKNLLRQCFKKRNKSNTHQEHFRKFHDFHT